MRSSTTTTATTIISTGLFFFVDGDGGVVPNLSKKYYLKRRHRAKILPQSLARVITANKSRDVERVRLYPLLGVSYLTKIDCIYLSFLKRFSGVFSSAHTSHLTKFLVIIALQFDNFGPNDMHLYNWGMRMIMFSFTLNSFFYQCNYHALCSSPTCTYILCLV